MDPSLQNLPIAVDLDGTLLRTDTLAEGFVDALLRRPLSTLITLTSLGKGRAQFKQKIHKLSQCDLSTLPVRTDLLDYLTEEKRKGRPIYLVTAATQEIADNVKSRFSKIIDEAFGSSMSLNLKAENKRKFLEDKFPDGYIYAVSYTHLTLPTICSV